MTLPVRRTLIVLTLVVQGHAFANEPAESDINILIREGIALHDQGLYDDAIEMYERALEIEPDNAYAGYEMAFAYQASGDFAGCIESAGDTLDRVASHDAHDHYVSNLYSVLASCHSASGESKEALQVFRNGLEHYPDHYSLNFNIAITLANTGDLVGSKERLIAAMNIDPAHPSPYYMLAEVLRQQGSTTALLAYIAFLQLEFNTDRSYRAAAGLFNSMHSPSAEDDPSVISINVDKGFSSASAQLQLAYYAAVIERTEDDKLLEPLGENLTKALASYIHVVASLELEDGELEYLKNHLLPKCRRLVEAGVTTPFAWYVADTAGVAGASDWLQSHTEDVDNLIALLDPVQEQDSN